MKQILLHEENIDINIAIEKENHLKKEQGDAMMGVIRKIILKTIRPAELVATIKKDLQLDDAAARKLALDLLGRRFLAMEWYIGKVEPLIRELGGDPAKYLAPAKKLYPEVYNPTTETLAQAAPAAPAPATEPAGQMSHPMLRDFDERLQTFKGRAEILLRLTGLSAQVEQLMHMNKLQPADGEELVRQLDALSFAINTQDLNPLEIQSIRRRLSRIIEKVAQVS